MSKLTTALRSVTRASLARFDAWANQYTGFGTARDKTTFGYVLPARPLSDQELSDLYHSDDMAARMVDVVPEEMFREPFEIETGDPSLDEIIKDKFEALDVRGHLKEGARWGRCYGGAGVLIGADDGRDSSKPLVPERAKDLSYLYVIDRRLLWPLAYYNEPGHPKLGQPSHYEVTVVGGESYVSSVVHESRLLLFRGSPTGIRERQNLMSWDLSYLQRAYEILRQFNTGWKSVETLMTDGNQAIFKMTGLAEMIESKGEEALRARLQIMELYRSVMRALVIDADAEESFERQTVSFENIPQTLDKFMLRLAAAVQIPVTILMGQSPAGMNATGESDFRWFYNRIAASQNTDVKPKVRRLVEIFLKSKASPVRAKLPKSINVKFPSLWTEPPLIEAQRELAVAQRDAAYVTAQVLMPDEVALSRFRPGGFEKDIQLTKDGIEAREAALKADLERLEDGAEEDETEGAFGGGTGAPPFASTPGGEPAQTAPNGPPQKGAPQQGAPAAKAQDDDEQAKKPGARFDGTGPRAFELVRHVDETGVSGTGIVAEGCLFEDGTVALRWKTATPGTTIFESVEHMLSVHGHGGKTELRFVAEARASRTDGGDFEPNRDEKGRFAPGGGGGDDDGKSGGSGHKPAASIADVKPTGGKDMHAAISEAAKGDRGGFLTVYSPSEYDGMKCFTAAGGKVGGALKDHGDGRIEAVSLFNNGGPPGSGRAMLDHLVAHGANYLECFDGKLSTLYASKGFVITSRTAWNDEYAPAKWDYASLGRPDLVTMSLKK